MKIVRRATNYVSAKCGQLRNKCLSTKTIPLEGLRK